MSRTVWGRGALVGAVLLAFTMSCAKTGSDIPNSLGPRHFEPVGAASAASVAPSASPSEQQALPFPFLDDLSLSADQRTQIMAIIQQYEPTTDTDAIQRWGQQLKDILSAPQLDQAKLRAAIQTAEQKRRAALQQLVPMFQAIRNVLTDQQRADAADAIEANLTGASPAASAAPSESAAPAESPAPAESATPEALPSPTGPAIKLTDAQKKLFRAAIPVGIDRPAAARALATLMRSGDAEPLKQALTPSQSIDEQVDARVKAIASLTTEQRQALVNYKPPQPEESASPEESAAPEESASPEEAASPTVAPSSSP